MNNFIASVIIPTWNGQELLKDCLSSLEIQTFKGYQVILVDNHSQDKTVDFVKTNFPKVKIVCLDKNYGFAKAINAGVKLAKTKYLVFLNNDTYLDKNWLKNLVNCADKHPEVISVNSKLLNFYNKTKIDGVGITINEVGQAKSIGWNEIDGKKYDSESYIFGATGGAALFKRDAFIKLGLFDEDYFMYSEEVDFAFRAQFAGFKSIYCPKAIVFHKHKASANKKPQHIEYWQFKNMTQTIIKNFPLSLVLKNWRWLKIILVHFNTIFYQLKNGFFWPPLFTELWLITHLPGLLAKRKVVQSNIKVSLTDIEKFLEPKKVTFWGLFR